MPLYRAFIYSVPASVATSISRGSRVVVPFKNRKEIGVVLNTVDSPVGMKLRDIQAVLDDVPSITEPLMRTAEWIAKWYAAPIGVTLRAMLPAALTTVEKLSPSIRKRRVVTIAQELPSIMQREKIFRRAKRQRVVYELLEAHGGSAELSALLVQAGCSRSVIASMEASGLVATVDEQVVRDPFAARAVSAPPDSPTTAQREAIATIINGEAGASFVLKGITGSGKTLVYIEVLREMVLLRGRTAIVLVPEIALTPQTVDRFRGAFGDDVAVLHSALSEGERYDAWQSLRRGERRIAIGARSALFAPLENVGVVIVDEEHETTYKQSETPRYHAREAAIMRARFEDAVVVLGSATPSLESMRRTLMKKTKLISLTERVAGGSLPPVEVVDMRVAVKQATKLRPPSAPYDESIGVLSARLANAIQKRLDNREQTLLLLNRRGYSSFVQCTHCGYVEACPHCSISLTYHKLPELLVCHYCNYQLGVSSKCGQCTGENMRRFGLGTQQVEKVVAERFPSARIARMDVDTTTGKWAHATILDKVASGDVDILLGTQMVAKGLDFPNVTLVGVVDADTGIGLPDFRAAERTFQLLSQVAGRAGRGPKGGEVIIQTRLPKHHAITFAVNHDYDGFAEHELNERREPIYPPFVSIANVVISGVSEKQTSEACIAATEWTRRLVELTGLEGIQLLGPAPCPISKIKDRYRWRFLIKSQSAAKLSKLSAYLAERCPVVRNADVRLIVDRDPVSLL